MNLPLTIGNPEPLELAGRRGVRYWVYHPFDFLGQPDTDKALCSFPLAVFQPPHRDPAHTPVLIGLQGMAAPYSWNSFLVPQLVDRGIACVLFDTPLAGERGVVPDPSEDVLRKLTPLVERGIPLTIRLVRGMFEAVARDIALVRELLRDRHGLTDERVALFGVSLGCLLASFTFLRDRHGQRLLGVIGHADLQAFARSYSPYLTPLLSSSPAWLVARALAVFIGSYPQAAVEFLAILGELGNGSATTLLINPMTYADCAGSDRRVRFLVGQNDTLVRADDAFRCASAFPAGACYVVPNFGHGTSVTGPEFEQHVRYFVATQLGDWESKDEG
jgi:pimeloyl-ACP methyl ester carboxylesterase